MKYLKLIRFPNLLILAAGMYLLRLMVVEPLLIMSHHAPVVSDFHFLLMVLSTVFIAAGGYIINDIEDVETDLINKPSKVIIGNSISKDAAWNIYLLITFTGICIGFYLTLIEKIRYVAYIEMVAAGILYFYSTTYKRMILIGNILVAALSAFSIALVYLVEPEAASIVPLKILASAYVAFAFVVSFAREIIKDIQDIKGDKESGCNTLPVVAGVGISKILVFCLVLLVLVALIGVQISSHQWDARISFIYVVLFIQIPLLLLLVSVVIASDEADFARCSFLTKTIMITGILSMPVFYYSF
ncbi:MAG: geranylgeranylglycerol-phosphate geranylgeranyltransferase [Bacteroidota bacterium]